MTPAEGWRNPRWFSEGMRVAIPYRHDGKVIGLWTTVVVATGNAARVENEKRGINQWVTLDGCAVLKDDPHAR